MISHHQGIGTVEEKLYSIVYDGFKSYSVETIATQSHECSVFVYEQTTLCFEAYPQYENW